MTTISIAVEGVVDEAVMRRLVMHAGEQTGFVYGRDGKTALRARINGTEMVPREKSGRRVGPAYASRLIQYVQEYWRPAVAAERSESLQPAIRCLQKLVKTTDKGSGYS